MSNAKYVNIIKVTSVPLLKWSVIPSLYCGRPGGWVKTFTQIRHGQSRISSVSKGFIKIKVQKKIIGLP